MRKRGTEAEARWRVLVSEQMGSGKSVAAFCRELGLPASQMFSWKKRFREAESAKFVEVAVKPALETAPAIERQHNLAFWLVSRRLPSTRDGRTGSAEVHRD